jgi:hypothetical protein
MTVGVDRTDYLMLAADMGANAFDWDHHAPEMEGHPNRRFDIVYDAMCGKYCLAGKVIAHSDPFEGFEMAKIDPKNLAIDHAALADAVSIAFDRKLTPADFSLILFSHFS